MVRRMDRHHSSSALSAMKLTQYLFCSDPIVDPRSRSSKRVIFCTRSGEARLVDSKTWELVEEGCLEDVPRSLILELTDLEFLVPAGEDELHTILARNRAAERDDPVLYQVIQPTAACQLGCGYCGQDHASRLLDAEGQDRLIDRIGAKLDATKHRALEVTWFGAEPLIGLSVIRNLSRRLRVLSRVRGCDFRAKLVTNGLGLTPAISRELVDQLDVDRVEITLDGLAEDHDSRRMTKTGRPTFERIYRNLRDLARLPAEDVAISVRCNVDKHNATAVIPLVEKLALDQLQYRIEFYLAYVHSWGNDADSRALSLEEFSQLEMECFRVMFRLGFALALLPPRKPITCMALRPSADLTDAFGNLFSCTEVSYVPSYGYPNRYQIGTLSGGETEGVRTSLTRFTAELADDRLPCSSCALLPVCGGSCPKQWLEGRKPCPAARINIKDRLALQHEVSTALSASQ